MARLDIWISDELYQRMEGWRDRLDISRVCEKALDKEVRRLNRKVFRVKPGAQPPDIPTGGIGG